MRTNAEVIADEIRDTVRELNELLAQAQGEGLSVSVYCRNYGAGVAHTIGASDRLEVSEISRTEIL